MPAPRPPIGPDVVEDASLIRRGLAGKTDLDTGIVSINPRIAADPKLANRVRWHETVHWLPGGIADKINARLGDFVRFSRARMWENSAINRVVEEMTAAGVDSWNPLTALKAPFVSKLVRNPATGEMVRVFPYRPFSLGKGDVLLALPFLMPSDSKTTHEKP